MSNKVIVIAEAGVNHNGDLKTAKKLIDAAADANADYVKFQTFKADKIVSRTAKKATYQTKNFNNGDDTQYGMLKKLEMPEKWHYELFEYAQNRGIAFLSTGFDEDSIDFLDQLGIAFFKIPSGEITNKPYLQHIARKKKKMIMSTGMATLEEIDNAITVLEREGTKRADLTVLHCNTEYPTPMQDVNLHAMSTIADELRVKVGYSDHTLGIEVPIAATALGAKVIEKHFTLDRNLPGPDHKASLQPDELKVMIRAIRNIELAISGTGRKEPSESESRNLLIVRKSLHYKGKLGMGHVLKPTDLVALRPGNGISPMDIENVIDRKLIRSAEEFEMVKFSDFQ